MKNIKKIALLISIIITSPFMALACLILINSVNPMQLAFLTSFKVENRSGEDVRITPIGTIGAKGRKAQLPVFAFAFPAIPAIKTGDFHLKNGDTLKVLYDWDDINFSEIAIESKRGQFYQLTIDSDPTENRYHSPETKHFIIPTLDTLPTIQPKVHEAATQRGRDWTYHIILLGAIVSLVIYWKMIKYYKKEKLNHLPTEIQQEMEG